MTITVIGHLCIDEVHTSGPDVIPTPGYGGIFYSLATLSALTSSKDTLHPVFGVGEQDYEPFMKAVAALPNVDPAGIFKFKGETNRVHVFRENGSNGRIECSKHIAEPIPFNRIKPYLDTDALLINMVSGSDIALDTLDRIRMVARDNRIPIHFDFHSLTLGVDQDFRRFRRPLNEWRRWCFMLNSIQMTETEAADLTMERFDEHTLVNHLMPLMVSALIITRGDNGSTAILQENKKLTWHNFDGQSFGPMVDATGCGDVFGAAFLYEYQTKKKYLAAAEFANRIAGYKATFSGTGGLRTIPARLEPVGTSG
jgi:sugar/nucleoside kinase (ribokinase family)